MVLWLLLFALGPLLPRAAVPRAPVAPPPLPISGDWLWGLGVAPHRGPVHAVAHCGSTPAIVHVVERDGAVEADVVDGTPMVGGAVHAPPPYRTLVTEHLRGRFDGTQLALTGTRDIVHRATGMPRAPNAPPLVLPPDVHEDVAVELRFERRTGHFVGTRNGASIWLARGTISAGTGGCPP